MTYDTEPHDDLRAVIERLVGIEQSFDGIRQWADEYQTHHNDESSMGTELRYQLHARGSKLPPTAAFQRIDENTCDAGPRIKRDGDGFAVTATYRISPTGGA